MNKRLDDIKMLLRSVSPSGEFQSERLKDIAWLVAEVERLRAALELIESMKPDEAEMEAAHVARQALGEK